MQVNKKRDRGQRAEHWASIIGWTGGHVPPTF